MRLSFLLIVFTVTLARSSHASSNLDKVSAIACTQHNQLKHGATRLLRFVETKEEVDDGDLDDYDDDQGAESEERTMDVKSSVNWVTSKVGKSFKKLVPNCCNPNGAVVRVGDDAVATGATNLKNGDDVVATGATNLKNGDDAVATGATNLKNGDDAVTTGATNLKNGDDDVATGATNLKNGDDAVATGATTTKRFFTNDGYSTHPIKRMEEVKDDLILAGVGNIRFKELLKAQSEPDGLRESLKIDELKTKLANFQTAWQLTTKRNEKKLLADQVLKLKMELSDAKRQINLVNEYVSLKVGGGG